MGVRFSIVVFMDEVQLVIFEENHFGYPEYSLLYVFEPDMILRISKIHDDVIQQNL